MMMVAAAKVNWRLYFGPGEDGVPPSRAHCPPRPDAV